jgi:hypothetical protein
MAEDAAHELPNLTLEDALQLVHLSAERGSPQYEKAAMRWLERYLTEARPGSGTSRRSQRISGDDVGAQRPAAFVASLRLEPLRVLCV